MKSSFRIIPLKTDVADTARRKARAGAADHLLVEVDLPRRYPCRHCLRWGEPGESVILFPFAAIAPGHPYSESGPIFVHAEECERYALTDEFPVDFRQNRSLRAYNSQYELISAEVAADDGPEAVIARFLQKPETAFVHVRSASHGCYTMEVKRR